MRKIVQDIEAEVGLRFLAEVPIAPPLLNIAGINSPPSCELILSV